jgi:hypothetical protein
MESTMRLTEIAIFRVRILVFMGTLLAAKVDPKLNGCWTGNAEVPATERLRARKGQMQEQLRIHRQILYDLALHYLEPLNGNFSRLAYLASLRDASTNRYTNGQLAAVYGVEAVGESLARCHEELFERLLETPLAQQEVELRLFLTTLPEGAKDGIRLCQDRTEEWIPPVAPNYLKELFRSNLTALLGLVRENHHQARSST